MPQLTLSEKEVLIGLLRAEFDMPLKDIEICRKLLSIAIKTCATNKITASPRQFIINKEIVDMVDDYKYEFENNKNKL